MIDLVPVVFVIFKVLMFGICMFFAIKWHYDQGKKGKSTRALLRTSGMVVALFVVALLILGYGTVAVAHSFGLDLTY